MKTFLFLLVVLILALSALFFYSRQQAAEIAERYPPVGTFVGEGETRSHIVDVNEVAVDAPRVLFIHGASGNLLDQHFAFAGAIRPHARAIFIDRPGHGHSARGGADDPVKQAARYAAALDELGMEKAIIVGHSLGGASAAAFAVLYPERTAGLVLLAPATHPWPGGVNWYYSLASWPVIGPIFAHTLVLPAGQASIGQGVLSTFEPNEAPESYVMQTAAPLVLRPTNFRYNAQDVAGLYDFVTDFSSRYREITAPTAIITGDEDTIVLPSIHSVALDDEIPDSELIVLHGVGHKPDYVATGKVIEAILAMHAKSTGSPQE